MYIYFIKLKKKIIFSNIVFENHQIYLFAPRPFFIDVSVSMSCTNVFSTSPLLCCTTNHHSHHPPHPRFPGQILCSFLANPWSFYCSWSFPCTWCWNHGAAGWSWFAPRSKSFPPTVPASLHGPGPSARRNRGSLAWHRPTDWTHG